MAVFSGAKLGRTWKAFVLALSALLLGDFFVLGCYAAGITYFGNTLAGDAFSDLLLFGGFVLVERTVLTLRSSASVQAEVIGAR